MGKKEFLKQAIELEQNMSDLYMYFHELFLEDREFWWELAHEEMHHAALLRSVDLYVDDVLLPKELINKNLGELKEANLKIILLIKVFKQSPPDAKEAFEAAIELERSAYELHFQKVMSEESYSNIMKVIQQLNQDDKDHVQRLKKYLNDKILERDYRVGV